MSEEGLRPLYTYSTDIIRHASLSALGVKKSDPGLHFILYIHQGV